MPIAIATSTIAQQAFRFMEMRPPASFGDSSEQATSAVEQYDVALAMCLEAVDWSFASAIASLPPVADETVTTADSRYPYAYALPGDCLMFREVLVTGAAYRLDENHLRCDIEGPLPVRYTRRITNETRMPGTFQTAVALQLAVLLAPRWVEVSSKIDRLEERLGDAIRRAAKTDARTASPTGWHAEANGIDWATEARL